MAGQGVSESSLAGCLQRDSRDAENVRQVKKKKKKKHKDLAMTHLQTLPPVKVQFYYELVPILSADINK